MTAVLLLTDGQTFRLYFQDPSREGLYDQPVLFVTGHHLNQIVNRLSNLTREELMRRKNVSDNVESAWWPVEIIALNFYYHGTHHPLLHSKKEASELSTLVGKVPGVFDPARYIKNDGAISNKEGKIFPELYKACLFQCYEEFLRTTKRSHPHHTSTTRDVYWDTRMHQGQRYYSLGMEIVLEHLKMYTEVTGQPFIGIDVNDLERFEEIFSVQVYLYTCEENIEEIRSITSLKICLTRKPTYTDPKDQRQELPTLHILAIEDHATLIVDVDKLPGHFCSKCSRYFLKKSELTDHQREQPRCETKLTQIKYAEIPQRVFNFKPKYPTREVPDIWETSCTLGDRLRKETPFISSDREPERLTWDHQTYLITVDFETLRPTSFKKKGISSAVSESLSVYCGVVATNFHFPSYENCSDEEKETYFRIMSEQQENLDWMNEVYASRDDYTHIISAEDFPELWEDPSAMSKQIIESTLQCIEVIADNLYEWTFHYLLRCRGLWGYYMQYYEGEEDWFKVLNFKAHHYEKEVASISKILKRVEKQIEHLKTSSRAKVYTWNGGKFDIYLMMNEGVLSTEVDKDGYADRKSLGLTPVELIRQQGSISSMMLEKMEFKDGIRLFPGKLHKFLDIYAPDQFDDDPFQKQMRKLFFPHDLMVNFSDLQRGIPTYEECESSFNALPPTEEEYLLFKVMCNHYGCETLGDWVKYYALNDVLPLIFALLKFSERYWGMSIDPIGHNLGIPSIAEKVGHHEAQKTGVTFSVPPRIAYSGLDQYARTGGITSPLESSHVKVGDTVKTSSKEEWKVKFIGGYDCTSMYPATYMSDMPTRYNGIQFYSQKEDTYRIDPTLCTCGAYEEILRQNSPLKELKDVGGYVPLEYPKKDKKIMCKELCSCFKEREWIEGAHYPFNEENLDKESLYNHATQSWTEGYRWWIGLFDVHNCYPNECLQDYFKDCDMELKEPWRSPKFSSDPFLDDAFLKEEDLYFENLITHAQDLHSSVGFSYHREDSISPFFYSHRLLSFRDQNGIPQRDVQDKVLDHYSEVVDEGRLPSSASVSTVVDYFSDQYGKTGMTAPVTQQLQRNWPPKHEECHVIPLAFEMTFPVQVYQKMTGGRTGQEICQKFLNFVMHTIVNWTGEEVLESVRDYMFEDTWQDVWQPLSDALEVFGYVDGNTYCSYYPKGVKGDQKYISFSFWFPWTLVTYNTTKMLYHYLIERLNYYHAETKWEKVLNLERFCGPSYPVFTGGVTQWYDARGHGLRFNKQDPHNRRWPLGTLGIDGVTLHLHEHSHHHYETQWIIPYWTVANTGISCRHEKEWHDSNAHIHEGLLNVYERIRDEQTMLFKFFEELRILTLSNPNHLKQKEEDSNHSSIVRRPTSMYTYGWARSWAYMIISYLRGKDCSFEFPGVLDVRYNVKEHQIEIELSSSVCPYIKQELRHSGSDLTVIVDARQRFRLICGHYHCRCKGYNEQEHDMKVLNDKLILMTPHLFNDQNQGGENVPMKTPLEILSRKCVSTRKVSKDHVVWNLFKKTVWTSAGYLFAMVDIDAADTRLGAQRTGTLDEPFPKVPKWVEFTPDELTGKSKQDMIERKTRKTKTVVLSHSARRVLLSHNRLLYLLKSSYKDLVQFFTDLHWIQIYDSGQPWKEWVHSKMKEREIAEASGNPAASAQAKLELNSMFGRSMMRVSTFTDNKIVHQKDLWQYVLNPLFKGAQPMDEQQSLWLVSLRKKEVRQDRNIQVGAAILQDSKLFLYTFVERIRWDQPRVKFLYTDTDCVIIASDQSLEDFVNQYPRRHLIRSVLSDKSKKIPGTFGLEKAGHEIVILGAKQYILATQKITEEASILLKALEDGDKTIHDLSLTHRLNLHQIITKAQEVSAKGIPKQQNWWALTLNAYKNALFDEEGDGYVNARLQGFMKDKTHGGLRMIKSHRRVRRTHFKRSLLEGGELTTPPIIERLNLKQDWIKDRYRLESIDSMYWQKNSHGQTEQDEENQDPNPDFEQAWTETR